VLEPSPPAVTSGEWLADDPVRDEGGPPGAPLVTPVPGVGVSWDAWLADHPERAAWASERWLGAVRRLARAPDALAETRLAWHRLAVYVVSPARRRDNGKIGLRWTLGGLGTPFFGADEQVRLAGDRLVCQRGASAASERVTTLARAAELALDGPPDLEWARAFDVPSPGDPEEPLPVDPAAAGFLSDWFGFAWSVLEELRADRESTAAGRVQLWPEHFDAAFDCRPDAEGRRATFGASPGDAATPEPYLYVLPRTPEEAPAGEAWNASAFRGAILPLDRLVDAPHQRAEALRFLRGRRGLLAG
jgi:hypothetical protein